MIKNRIAITALTSVVLAGLATFGTATAANASTGTCNSVKIVNGASVPALNGSTTCNLVYGDSSSAVQALQYAIVYCYGVSIGSGGFDKDFGKDTRAGLEAVQTEIGVNSDGMYGPQTHAAMVFFIATEGHC